MPTLALIIAILVALVGFIDFLVGEPGDRRLKQALVHFYVAMEAGDWSALYRYPARALLDFMQRWFGKRRFAIRYFLIAFILSTVLTTFFFVLSISVSYLLALKTETACEIPVFARFLQIPAYMAPFLLYIYIINIIFDYISWSLAQQALETLAESRGWKAVLVFSSMFAAAVLILFVMYTIYLPLSIIVEMQDHGFTFSFSDFLKILQMNVTMNWRLFQLPQPIFDIDCSKGYSIFSITYIGTMQILALETMLPFVLLLISTGFGLLIYVLRPLARKPLSFAIERLESSPKHIVVLIGGFVIGVLTLAVALIK
jgi:hypothetical protein